MRVVYEAANLIDAHLVKHALEALEIPVFLRGESLLGAMGELPLFGMIAVCVPDVAWPEADACVRALDLGGSTTGAARADEDEGGAQPAPA